MARVLIVGGGSGRAGELADSGHVVTEATGDPDRLATLTPQLEDVSVLCWLFGESSAPEMHGERLAALLEYLVDTPVRGFVYERAAQFPDGEDLVRRAEATFRLRTEVLDPGGDVGDAVARVLAA